jgi:hypothetical protein
MLVATVAAWHTVRYTLYGIPASGRVLAFRHPASRSMDTIVQLEVSVPGVATFREQIEDNFSTDDWDEGATTLSLRCIPAGSGHFDCGAGLGAIAFIPLLLFLAGAVLLWWGLKRLSR